MGRKWNATAERSKARQSSRRAIARRKAIGRRGEVAQRSAWRTGHFATTGLTDERQAEVRS